MSEIYAVSILGGLVSFRLIISQFISGKFWDALTRSQDYHHELSAIYFVANMGGCDRNDSDGKLGEIHKNPLHIACNCP